MTNDVTQGAASALTAATPEWKGTDRYEVVRRLGQGGMGVVYEAFDRETQRYVALKTLRQFTPAALYRFKQEFRTVADVQHPNLLNLYELVATEPDHVFFAMELVRGTNFLQYVRGRKNAPNLDRLRDAVRQLVEGLLALHGAGIMHRDIKPSNVLVTREGRVVLLDFGVARSNRSAESVVDEDDEIVGTASYMAPEQAWSHRAPDPAGDWYSVGAILYAALVGAPPFVGTVMDVIAMKNTLDPPSPRDHASGVPADLDALCTALLQRVPDTRPAAAEILERLGVGRAAPSAQSQRPAANGGTLLIGREAHLDVLGDAFQAARSGRSITVLVGGRSGMGKSALLRRFLEERAARDDAVVFRGRAYERESVPYKAVDSVVDALSRYPPPHGGSRRTHRAPGRCRHARAHLSGFPARTRGRLRGRGVDARPTARPAAGVRRAA